jgi:pimeloyl-ACP methyl ester carboxylesterase
MIVTRKAPLKRCADLMELTYGGWLTLNYAIATPERLKKIALLSPPGSFVPLAKQFFVRLMLMRYVGGRFPVENFVRWITYEENLYDPLTRAIGVDGMTAQMYLGLRYFRLPGEAPPIVFSDEELRDMQVPTLLLIGQQEVIYDPKAALERARRLIPNFEGELVPRSSHDMSISKHEIVDRRILEFLKR